MSERKLDLSRLTASFNCLSRLTALCCLCQRNASWARSHPRDTRLVGRRFRKKLDAGGLTRAWQSRIVTIAYFPKE